MKLVIPNYKEGSNISILNVDYSYGKKLPNGKRTKPFGWILYKDLDTGVTYKHEMDDPTYVYYYVKDEIPLKSNRELFSRVEDCIEIEVPGSQLYKDIAKRTNQMQLFNDNCKNGNFKANRYLHLHPRLRGSDMMIQNNIMYRFDRQYKNEIFKPTKGYFDIETDNNYLPPGMDFPTDGMAPINTITYFNDELCEAKVYVLIDPNNQSSVDFLNDFKEKKNKMLDELKDSLKNHVGDILYDKYLNKINYKFKIFYNDEISLLKTFFNDVNKEKPNIMLAWNIAFDLPFIIDRLKVLGLDPEEVICSPEFKNKICEYRLDFKNSEPQKRNNVYKISSYSVYMDQMIHFASRRKSNTSIQKFNLDSIGDMVCGIKKLEWKHIARRFKDFIRRDFKTFVFYNVMDVLVQKCIEDEVDDVDFALATSIMNCTILDKIYRPTVSLTTRAAKEAYLENFILGNNHNIDNQKKSYPGAFVADGSLNSDFSKMTLCGNPVNLYNNLNDFDFKSLYPNIERQFNISFTTQIGRIYIPSPILPNENPFNNPYYNRAGRFMEDYSVDNPINFGYRWLGLGNFEQLYQDVIDYLRPYNVGIDTTKDISIFKDNNSIVKNKLLLDNKYSSKRILCDLNRPNEDIVNKVKNIQVSDIYNTSGFGGGALGDFNSDFEE